MTADQSRAHCEGLRNNKRGEASSYRRLADEYRRAAHDCDDPDLRRVQFDESSRLAALARECDRDADAIEALLVSEVKR